MTRVKEAIQWRLQRPADPDKAGSNRGVSGNNGQEAKETSILKLHFSDFSPKELGYIRDALNALKKALKDDVEDLDALLEEDGADFLVEYDSRLGDKTPLVKLRELIIRGVI